MLPLLLDRNQNRPLNVLCLGAHCDDIEIGCGGTVLGLCESNPDTIINWIVFASNDTRYEEALASAHEFLQGVKNAHIEILQFRDGFFPYIGHEIKEKFEALKTTIQPDVIFTHYRDDLHQDHRIVNELTLNTFRNHLIFEYEIIKYDGDIGNPNVYFPLETRLLEKKCELLTKHYVSQNPKSWFTKETFTSMARLRGVEANSASGYAEAFYGRKITIA
ncbi:MAG: PIG-L deacetylase family protein [Anaerolineales bacterium]